jgi:hypothetical protein
MQEEELYGHCKLHSALRGVPDRRSRSKGEASSTNDFSQILEGHCTRNLRAPTFLCTMQEAVEHAQATGHVNFQEYK